MDWVSKHWSRWDISVPATNERDQRSERACSVGGITCHVLLLEHEVNGRVLGEALDARREHLEILLKGMVSQRSTFHLTCQYFIGTFFPPHIRWVCCILLKIIVVLFELLSGRKQRTIMRTAPVSRHVLADATSLVSDMKHFHLYLSPLVLLTDLWGKVEFLLFARWENGSPQI